MNDTKDKQDLWLRYVEGETLSRREKRMLLDWLGADESARRACLEDERIAGFLSAYGNSQLTHARFIEQTLRRLAAEEQGRQFRTQFERRLRAERSPTRSAPAFGWRFGLAAAAMLLILAGLWIAHRPGPATVADARHIYRILTAEGTVRDGQGRTLTPGAVLSPGTHIATGRDGYAVLIGRDGSDISLAPDTSATLLDGQARDRLVLSRGALYAQIRARDKAEPPFRLRTAAGHRLTVLGTKFEVLADGSRTELRVESGRVLLETGRDSVVANAGQSIVADGDRIGAAQPVARRAIAPWKFEREPLVDGPVLFEDDFEHGLDRWQTRYYPKDSMQATDPLPDDHRPSIIDNAGRTAGSSALELTGPTQPDTTMTMILPIDLLTLNLRGAVVEYDARLIRREKVTVTHFVYRTGGSRKIFPSNADNYKRIRKIPQSGQWYRVRIEHRLRNDDQAEPCLEIKSYVNGLLEHHAYCYPDVFHFGVLTIREGKALIDNFVARELIPASHAATSP